MYCQKCGIENPEEAKFCKDCGFQFQKDELIKCSICGAENSNITKFCGSCGTTLSNQSISKIARDVLIENLFNFRFLILPMDHAKGRDTYTLIIDYTIIKTGLLRDGLDCMIAITLDYHEVELKIVFYDIFNSTTEVFKNFHKKIDFSSLKGEIIKFKPIYSPIWKNYFIIE